jgi:type II secretory pathway component GspD/PulD (secretin)
MKLKLAIIGLVAIVAAGNIVSARDNTPAADTNAAAASAPATPAAPATPDASAPATDANAPAKTADAAPAKAADATPAPVVVAQTTPAAPADAAPAASATAPAPAAPADATPTNTAAHDPNAIIPLIVMDEVPLTDAIKNLARQAGLNYMLDPKINYGGLKPDGTPNTQPTISLRWENLTADQALNAVLKTYNLVIQDDPKTKIALITIKDPAAPDPLVTKIIQLKYSDPTNMVSSVQTVLLDKRSKVIADVRTSQLVLVATEKEVTEVDDLVGRLDTQTKEVLIEAKLVELSKNPTSVKGIDWSGTLQAQHFSFGNGNVTGQYTSAAGTTTANNGGTGSLPVGSITPPYIAPNPVTLSTTTQTAGGGLSTTTVSAAGTGQTAGTVDGYSLLGSTGAGGLAMNTAKGLFPGTAFLNADGVNGVLSFLNTEADAKVLSTPRAVTLDNQEAILSVTTAQPIFKTTAGTQGSPGGAEITYTNLGTILRVTPRISANNTINLRVIPEVSDLGGTITKTVSGLTSQADFFDIRKVDTRVLIPSGNTLVMGGLVSDNSTKGNTKVPLLGDIPLLGWAFRQESKTQNKRNLLIFITPTIVHEEDFQPAQTDFLKTKMDDKPTTKFGAWDSGNPQDWSRLFGSKKAQPDELDDAK